MAKNNSRIRNWLYIILALLTLAGIFAGGVLAWGDVGSRMDTHTALQETQLSQITTDADDLKAEGCKPAKINSRAIDLIKYQLDDILNEIQTTQQTIESDTKEILRRLP